MGRKLTDLASRFRDAVEASEAELKAAEEAHRRSAERAATRVPRQLAARAELLGELQAFADALGHARASVDPRGVLTLAFRDHTATFAPDEAPNRLRIRYAGAVEGELLDVDVDGDEPVWTWSRGAQGTAVLTDDLLEELFVVALGLPRPEPEPAPEPEPEVAPEPVADAAPEAPRSVEQALADRRRQKWAERPRPTQVIGGDHSPWDVRPTNPGKAPRGKRRRTGVLSPGSTPTEYKDVLE